MKNLTYFFFVISLCCLALVSCGDDEPTFADELVGTWNLLSITATGCDDPSDNLDFDFGTSGCTTFMGAEICTNGTYTFTSGGTYRTGGSISSGSQILVDLSAGGTYTVDGNSVTICDDADSDCGTATVTIANDRMTVVTTDDGCTATQVYFK